MTAVTFTTLAPDPSLPPPPRLGSGSAEFDLVTGGGFVRGATYLIAGDPGAGKSTLLLQIAAAVAHDRDRRPSVAAYLTAEEAASQVQRRAERLGVAASPVRLAATNDLSAVLTTLAADPPTLLVVDSIQTMLPDPTFPSAAGSPVAAVAAVRLLTAFAHAHDAVVIIVCHVTKANRAAGPNTLQHEVDAVLKLDATAGFRALRATKNRFGSTQVVGLFRMTDRGLVGITDAASNRVITEPPTP